VYTTTIDIDCIYPVFQKQPKGICDDKILLVKKTEHENRRERQRERKKRKRKRTQIVHYQNVCVILMIQHNTQPTT